jgi:Flp pilus assembly protein TadG
MQALPGFSRRGSTVVETSLVLTVFLITFIGLIDLGSVLFRLQGLTERARAGARYGVVNTFDATKIHNVVVYGNSAGTGTVLLGLSTSLVTVTNVDLGDGISKVRVVIANYPFRFFTPVIASNKTLPNIEVALTTESLGATS